MKCLTLGIADMPSVPNQFSLSEVLAELPKEAAIKHLWPPWVGTTAPAAQKGVWPSNFCCLKPREIFFPVITLS